MRQLNPVKPKDVQKLSSSPQRNAIFGLAVGILLASLIVYALARFDNRLRSLAEIEEAFQTEILTAIPAVRRPIMYESGQPRPAGLLRDPLQRLHTSLQVGNAHGAEGREQPRTILFVSADAGDGQSTVVADLALILRDAGEAVAIVEADFRRPVLGRLLGVSGRQGLAEVLEGRLAVGAAVQDVGALASADASSGAQSATGAVATVVEAPVTGSASVLVGGTTSPIRRRCWRVRRWRRRWARSRRNSTMC